MKTCHILGIPVQDGASQPGCLMGPDAYRTAGLAQAIAGLGFDVTDMGNCAPAPVRPRPHANAALRNLPQVAAWAEAVRDKAHQAASAADLAVFLGGDHSLSIGTIAGVTRHAAAVGQPQFLLWLDAHPDLHRLETTQSGNLHGTPMGYLLGLDGFADHYPPLTHPVAAANLCMIGLRSVDPAESALIQTHALEVHDMRALDEFGLKAPLTAFLDRVRAADGRLHVSFDVDFLDPTIAPAVGTTVPGGATFREAHLAMELLHDSGLVTSLDLVELNPFLDLRGQTASLMVDLCASLLGRTVLDRMTQPQARAQ